MSQRLVKDLIIAQLTEHHLLTAPQLVTNLHTLGHTYNKTSIYRALDKLQSANVVCKQSMQDDEMVYELRSHHHDHLVCTNCGRVQTTECQVSSVTLPDNFEVDHHHLTFYGRCAECQLNRHN